MTSLGAVEQAKIATEFLDIVKWMMRELPNAREDVAWLIKQWNLADGDTNPPWWSTEGIR